MDNIISYFEQLNFTQVEIKIYLAIVKAGSITARDLAETLGMRRTQVYPSLDLLFKKGLVMKMVKGSQTHFAAIEPKDSLPILVTQKAHDLHTIKTDLPTILATLEGLQGEEKEEDDVEIKYYKGKAGVKKIYKEALEAKELRSYVNIKEIGEVFPDNFLLFNDAFTYNPDLKMFEVVEDSPQARRYIQTSKKKKNYLQKMLPKGMKVTAQDILIYENHVALIHLKDNTHGIVLRNPDLYNNFKLLFDFNWNTLPVETSR